MQSSNKSVIAKYLRRLAGAAFILAFICCLQIQDALAQKAYKGYIPKKAPRIYADTLKTGEQIAVTGLRQFKQQDVPTGVLLNRLKSFNQRKIEGLTRQNPNMALSLKEWRSIYEDINSKATTSAADLRAFEEMEQDIEYYHNSNIVPILIGNLEYNTFQESEPDPTLNRQITALEKSEFFMASVTRKKIYTLSPTFFFGKAFFLSNHEMVVPGIELDLDDGHGFRKAHFEETIQAFYSSSGTKNASIRITKADGTFETHFRFDIVDANIPSPDWIFNISNGLTAYAVKSSLPRSKEIKNPIVFVEGFDPQNERGYHELFEFVSQRSFGQQLLAMGFDLVIVNFNDGGGKIQDNAAYLSQFLKELNNQNENPGNIIIIGASMGGIVARYALSKAEAEGQSHFAHFYASFDSPHRGANLPIGIQQWLKYFGPYNPDAEEGVNAITTMAARQMLVLSLNGGADHKDLYSELHLLGYPSKTRNVAIANGSGTGIKYGFEPGDKIIDYRHRSILVNIDGNAYAVRGGGLIFHGFIDPIFPNFGGPGDLLPSAPLTYVFVEDGIPSYDNAPGGYRSTMGDLDQSTPDYGDIKAPYGHNHCFIPTISALDVNTEDLFYNIKADPYILDKIPFDAFYVPNNNEEHVEITDGNISFILNELSNRVIDKGETIASYPKTVFAPETIVAQNHVVRPDGQLRAYPITLACLNAMYAQARCSIAS